jgi:hypothetical protein
LVEVITTLLFSILEYQQKQLEELEIVRRTSNEEISKLHKLIEELQSKPKGDDELEKLRQVSVCFESFYDFFRFWSQRFSIDISFSFVDSLSFVTRKMHNCEVKSKN